MIKVITTVGTSIFENYLKKNNSIRTQFETLKDKPNSGANNYTLDIEQVKKTISAFVNEPDASAEIKSLLKIKEKYFLDKMHVYLICTDTILSFLSAQILKEFYSCGKDIVFEEPILINGLSLLDKEIFEKIGLINLITEVNKIINSDNNKSKFIFNITGGYKAVIPFLTIFGQLMAVDLFYIFETTDELIQIPQLPIQFETTLAEKYYYALSLLKDNLRINSGYKLKTEYFNDLNKVGFVTNNAGNHIITGPGLIFMRLAENKMTIAKGVLGHIVELKLFEFYVRNPDNNFPFVEHSNNELNDDGINKPGGEIDLLLKKEQTDGISNNVIIEIKSVFQFIENKLFKGVLDQFESKIKLINDKNLQVAEYRFFIHTIDPSIFKGGISNDFKEKLKKIKGIAVDKNVQFFFVFINLMLTSRDNPYKEFMTTKLTFGTNIKEIIIH